MPPQHPVCIEVSHKISDLSDVALLGTLERNAAPFYALCNCLTEMRGFICLTHREPSQRITRLAVHCCNLSSAYPIHQLIWPRIYPAKCICSLYHFWHSLLCCTFSGIDGLHTFLALYCAALNQNPTHPTHYLGTNFPGRNPGPRDLANLYSAK
jgi:hypothetical protein